MNWTFCVVALANFALFARAEVVLDLVFHEEAAEKELVCNDGTPGGYYIRRSPEDATEDEKSTWIFHQQGGGWCYDDITCKDRIFYSAIFWQLFISSKYWPSQRKYTGGIFDMQGTPFEKANLVFLPYCSSDAHMADTERMIHGVNVQFRGRALAFAAITGLIGQKVNQTVLFGGTSAGGRGSMVTIDFLAELLHPSTTLRGLHDSGNYVDIPSFDPNNDAFGVQCFRAYSMYNNPPVPENCAVEFPGEEWRCLCGEFMLPLVKTPSQVVIYQYDSYQLEKNTGVEPKNWTEEICRYVEIEFLPRMLSTIDSLASVTSPHVVFAPACYFHGINTEPLWNQISIDGITAQEQLVDWLFDNHEKVSAISDCSGVNCQETCPAIELGPSSRCT